MQRTTNAPACTRQHAHAQLVGVGRPHAARRQRTVTPSCSQVVYGPCAASTRVQVQQRSGPGRRQLVVRASSAGSPFKKKDTRLVLEDGSVWHGVGFGAKGTQIGEVVFNTSITGYQEIMTDPSYKGQFVVFTHPRERRAGGDGGCVSPNGRRDAGRRRAWVRPCARTLLHESRPRCPLDPAACMQTSATSASTRVSGQGPIAARAVLPSASLNASPCGGGRRSCAVPDARPAPALHTWVTCFTFGSDAFGSARLPGQPGAPKRPDRN